MRYEQVALAAMGYELGSVVVGTDELEARLAPLYAQLQIPEGHLQALTGVVERRWWPRGFELSDGAVVAARKALSAAGFDAVDLDAVVYAGVCRENFEPATACRVASALGVSASAWVFDVSNACLGMLNAVVDLANRIELGQMRRALIVSCENARDIVDEMIQRMVDDGGFEQYKSAIATLTRGSGAAAILLSTPADAPGRPLLLGGTARAAPEYHGLSVWGIAGEPGRQAPFMATDSAAVLRHGVDLAAVTFTDFLATMNWEVSDVDRTICHQVGTAHRDTVLGRLGLPVAQDFGTHPYLGNMGTVALPVAACIAEERRFLRPGDRVGFLGIGSGLNCLMLGWQW